MGNCARGPPKQTKQTPVVKTGEYVKAFPKPILVSTDSSPTSNGVLWKVFTELDTQDEADMIALAGFFQVLSESTLVKAVDMGSDVSEATSDDVGRGGQGQHELLEHHIDPREKITLKIALDIIDCFRRGGKLQTLTVHKVLRDTYFMLKQFPNIRHANTTGADQKVTVVGDLHGQLTDLLYIIDAIGPPSDTNKIIFNGDFVDRGPASLQVTLILFALQLAAPEHIFLNRGNHEDASICCVYGFMKECLAAYDEITFSMFVEVFRHLPLATIIDSQVIVLHGGLFSQSGVSLEDLMAADRKMYSLDKSSMTPSQFQSSSPEKSPQTDDDAKRQHYLIELVTEMLWSDPQPIEGRLPNPRGEGIIFGTEPTIEFLKTNDLRLIVRSHECVRSGFDQPFEGDGKDLLCTIFSASNYAGSGNHGAFMTFTTCAEDKGSNEVRPLDHITERNSEHVGATTDAMHKLYYTVHSYGGDTEEEEQDLQDTTRASLANLILRKKEPLRKAFEAEDAAKTGEVPMEVFAKVMEDVTQIHVEWRLLLPLLLPGRSEGIMVDYNQLLGGFQLQLEGISTAGKEQNRACFDGLYVNRRELEAMFAFFDKDNDGSISRAEFRQGCEALNAHLPAESQLTGLERVMDLLDFDRSGTIEVTEFFEGFRFMDLRDGKEDGKINIPIKSAAAKT
ncbi:hypothetical protein VYU27_000211 [Nannochloropsis oceanica]